MIDGTAIEPWPDLAIHISLILRDYLSTCGSNPWIWLVIYHSLSATTYSAIPTYYLLLINYYLLLTVLSSAMRYNINLHIYIVGWAKCKDLTHNFRIKPNCPTRVHLQRFPLL